MKRYIKSTVITDVFLTDWIAKHKDNHPDTIVIDDRTPHTGEWEENYDGEWYIDCPGVVFVGTYEELISGGGDNLLFETYGEEEYQERLAHYLVLEEEDFMALSKPEHWIKVYSV